MFSEIKKVYPNIEIKFKNESKLMRFLGVLLFFHKDFMTKYSTIWGNAIYFPSREWLREDPIRAYSIIIHELTHFFDRDKVGKYIFNFAYFCPQIFGLLYLPLHLFHFDIASYIVLLFLLPWPSPRAYYEKRAYLVQLYALKKMHDKFVFTLDLEERASKYRRLFRSLDYYFMFPFSIQLAFDLALQKIKKGDVPFESPYFALFDQIINSIDEKELLEIANTE